MQHIAALVTVAVLTIAGCQVLERSIETTIPRHPDEPSNALLRLVVRDRTGLVISVANSSESGQTPFSDFGVKPLPADPSTLLVYWIGESCDRQVDMTFAQVPAGYSLTIATDQGSDECHLNGYGRAILLRLATVVAADTIVFRIAHMDP